MITLIDRLNSLCFYREILEKPILKEFYELIKLLSHPDNSIGQARQDFYQFRSKCADYAIEIENPVAQSVWENLIIENLTNSNHINSYLEENKKAIYKDTLLTDLETIASIYNFDFNQIIEIVDPGAENIFSKKIFRNNSPLAKKLKSADADKIYKELIKTIKKEGLGLYKNSKVFRINPKSDHENEEVIIPVKISNPQLIDNLIGYERQKERLIQNTRSFINGTGGLNTLLYGEMGTGKSTMVHSLIELFKDSPLRFIEIKKEEIEKLPEVIRFISDTPYPFIIFIDDLSFENDDRAYRSLKNSLEGSFESFPDNILLYATSNKRTLISQSKSEREDAVNAREILEEKLSLVSRFGLTIPFTVPNQTDYLDIVEKLINRYGLIYDDSIREEAIQWELRHMNRSGRTAEQFVKYLQSRN